MKFSIKDIFSKCDKIQSFPQIWTHLLKKSLMENLIFYEVFKVFSNQLLPNFLILYPLKTLVSDKLNKQFQ